MKEILLFIIILSPHIISINNPEEPRYGGTFVTVIGADPEHLNPALTTSAYAIQVGSLFYNSLLSYDLNGNPQPELAESWKVSPDGLTYTFYLVKNATWHDGKKFTSADVKFSFEQVLFKYHARMVAIAPSVSSIETPDEYTVVVRMKEPVAAFIYMLGHHAGFIIPKHIYEGTDILKNPHNFGDVIGTGPFKFVSWKKGESIIAVRNENYFRKGRPYLDRVVVKIIPDGLARVRALKLGEVDYLWYYTLPISELADLLKDPNLIATEEGSTTYPDMIMCFLNLRSPILSKLEVRKALAHSINKTEIIEKTTFGFGKEAIGPFPSTSPYLNPNVTRYDYNPAKAEALLDAAGFKRGPDGIRFKLSVIFDAAKEAVRKASEIMREQLKKIGVELLLKPMDRAAYVDAVFIRWDFDIFMHPMATGPVPDAGIPRLYVSWNIVKSPFTNAAGYNNSKVDELFRKAMSATNEVERTKYFQDVQKIIVDELPMIWLYEEPTYSVYRKEFAGVTERLFCYYEYDGIWWMKGSPVSPESALASIKDAEATINDLKAKGYDIEEAVRKIEDARSALSKGDYATAQKLASEAIKVAKPPFPWTLVGIGLGVVIIAIGGMVYLVRKRRVLARFEK
jgi:peptide/nickel transport system substrate-binding protein